MSYSVLLVRARRFTPVRGEGRFRLSFFLIFYHIARAMEQIFYPVCTALVLVRTHITYIAVSNFIRSFRAIHNLD